MKGSDKMPTMKRAKPKSGDTIVRSVILPKETDARILAIAQREERPLSWIIARAVKEFIERDEKRVR
jgi:predicted transcriptional regulator